MSAGPMSAGPMSVALSIVALSLFGMSVIFAMAFKRLRDEQPSMPPDKALEHDVERVSTYEPPPAAT